MSPSWSQCRLVGPTPHSYAVVDGVRAPASSRVRVGRPPVPAARAARSRPRTSSAPAAASWTSNTSRVVAASGPREPAPQQGVALLEHPLVVGACRLVPRRDAWRAGRRGSRAAPPARPSPAARSSGANTVTRMRPSRSRRPGDGLAVELHPVAALRPDLGLEELHGARRRPPRRAGSPARSPCAPARASGTPRNDLPGRGPARPPRAGWSCPARWRRRSTVTRAGSASSASS